MRQVTQQDAEAIRLIFDNPMPLPVNQRGLACPNTATDTDEPVRGQILVPPASQS